jgi:uncharacterized protein with HEPN domain
MPSGNPCLSSSDPRQHYKDILDAIEAIESFTEGMNFEAFRTDPKTVAAVERKLLQIAEAALRLRGQPLPEQPWRNIRGMGNWLRHQYDRVSLDILWSTVTQDLPALKAIASHALGAARKLPTSEQ